MYKLIIPFLLFFLLLGCSSKNKIEKNLTANALHSKINPSKEITYKEKTFNSNLEIKA